MNNITKINELQSKVRELSIALSKVVYWDFTASLVSLQIKQYQSELDWLESKESMKKWSKAN